MDTSLLIAIIIPLLGVFSTGGGILWRIKTLEKKMDKHNGLVEKMCVAENDIKTIKEDIAEIKHNM